MLFLVSYTLNPERKVPSIEDELKASDGWWHSLDYTWIIATKETVDEFYKRLAIRFRDTDHFLIVQITTQAGYAGWLPEDAWEWLANNRNY